MTFLTNWFASHTREEDARIGARLKSRNQTAGGKSGMDSNNLDSRSCLAEECRKFPQRAVLVDCNDVHFTAHQSFVLSSMHDLLPEG